MLVDKCHLADIHKPTRRLKLTKNDSGYEEDSLQALAWIADKLEDGCIVTFDERSDRSIRVNPDHPDGVALCQTANIGNWAGFMPLLDGLVHLCGQGKAFSVTDLDLLMVELEYGNTAPFSKYLIQK